MKNDSEDPRNKGDQSKINTSSNASNSDNNKSESESERRRRARNYNNGEDDIEGPDFNRESKASDGDTTVNAGIFK